MAELKYQYSFPTDDLDKIIQDRENGIEPAFMPDLLKQEVELRYKQLQEELYGTSDPDEIAGMINSLENNSARIAQKAADERRRATTSEGIYIKLSDKKKQELRKAVSSSIVRPDPTSPYNIDNDKLKVSKARREIIEKLKTIKHCYYRQEDYRNAIQIIMDAIHYSLGREGDGDYPHLTYQQALAAFNRGEIKFKFCQMPQLVINHTTVINDPTTLKGIITGDIILRDVNEKPKTVKKNKPYTPVQVEYNTINASTVKHMQSLHRAGYNTPLSFVFDHQATTYNPGALPLSNIFSNNNINNKNNNLPNEFDWLQDNAAQDFYDIKHGKKFGQNELVKMINESNGGNINNAFANNVHDWLTFMKHGTTNISGGYDYSLPNYMQQNTTTSQLNTEAASIEKALMASISMANVNNNGF